MGAPDPTPAASNGSIGRANARLRFALVVVVVAVGAAAFAIAFRAALVLVYRQIFHAHDVLQVLRALPPWARVALPATGGLLAGLASMAAEKRTGGGSVGDVMEAVALGGTKLSLRRTGLKALGSWLAITSGGSIGREGPLIQFGAALGSALSRAARLPDVATRGAIAAGTAAGFAAAYNTPLAAILFVLEIVTGIIVVEALLPVMIATAIATALTRAVVGGGPIYGERSFTVESSSELLAFGALGVVAAVASHAFMAMLSGGEKLAAKSSVPQPMRAALGGALVGVIAMFLPEVAGNGYEPLNLLLDGRFSVALLAILLVAKAVATTSSVSTGSPGGVFTPTLLVGGIVGMLFGIGVEIVLGHAGARFSFALVGMAAASAATTHAPLMASVLVFELSGDYAIVLPLVLATAVATGASRAIRRESIYTAELRGRPSKEGFPT